jgi:predicted Zn finger-like uncharacterized protein
MKFLCDNCKAKYQIADEKVAGRTVRMKCRKCSHLIEIRASVTETSVALSAPPAAGGAVGEATMQVSADALAAPRPATGTGPHTPGVRAPSPAVKTAPRPGAAGALRGASSGQLAAVKSSGQKAEPSGSLATGGLAGAFSDSVKSEPGPAFEESPTHALDMASGSLTEEWYVGINGVPVGPVRLTEFRAKIQSGAVTGDSLVWREGFEEWLPLRNFPELNDILKSSTQSDRSSPVGRPGSGSGARPLSAIASSALRSKSSASFSAVSGSSASSVAPTATSGSRSNVVAFGKGAPATAEKLELHPEPQALAPEPVADPFAAPAPIADPFAAPAPAAVPVAAVPVAANFAPVPEPAFAPATPTEAPAQKRGGIPLAGWIAIAAALGLGVAAGSVLSSKPPPPPPTVQIVTVSAVAPPAPAPTETGDVQPDTSAAPTASIAAIPTAKTGGGAKVAVAAPEKTADPPATPTVGAIPAVGGVGAIGVVGGPAPGPSPTTGGGGGGAEKLTGEQVSSVVNAGKNALRRACWEPALSARAPNGPSSARVVVSMTIGPDGRVKSASASGGDGFPTLASCIGSRVRSWVFPTSQTTTQTAPSFSFVAQ